MDVKFKEASDNIELLICSALLKSPEWVHETKLLCPQCGYDYLHISASGVHQNDTITLFTNDGVRVLRGTRPLGRGSAIVSLFVGECGHSFVRVERFHKGNVFTGCQMVDANLESLSTLWRD